MGAHLGGLQVDTTPDRRVGDPYRRVAESARVRPGDTLAVRVHRECTDAEMDELGRTLREAMPDVQVVVLGGGVEQLAVIEGGAR